MVAGQHYDVTICFPDLARKPVKVRWVMQVGDANFDENDDDWWWTDEEYPDAVGVYVAKLNNSAYLDRHSGLLAWLSSIGWSWRSLDGWGSATQ